MGQVYSKILVLLIITGLTIIAEAQEEMTSGRLQFESTAFGLILGFNRGNGILTMGGKDYPFSIKGLKLATIGVSRIDAIGAVYHLSRIEAFNGRYMALEGSLTIALGGGNALLRNQHGVIISLQTLQKGVELTLGGGGLEITLDQAVDNQQTPQQSEKESEVPQIQWQSRAGPSM